MLNQGIVWDPVTGPGERYTKWHPVVYGEYIPFRGFMKDIGLEEHSQLSRIPRDMLSGTRETPLPVNGIELADSICFDIAYDDGIYAQVERGADMLDRADQQRELHLHRPDRPAVRDHQAPGDRAPAAGWRWPPPTASRV